MPVTKSLSSLSNAKQLTGADSPQNPGSLVTYTYGPVASTAGQTVINLGFSVPTSNTANFFLWIDGKLMSLGSSNDYTFTNTQANGTSSQVTMNQTLAVNMNINAVYLGVVIPTASTTSILTINATLALQPTRTVILNNTSTNGRTITVAGTYNTPSGCKYLKIRMVGGGGGGSSNASASGSPGGATTFGTSLLSAGGGGGGNANGNAGTPGTSSLGTGPTGLALPGSYGGGDGGAGSAGGQGGSSAFGGGGGGGFVGNGAAFPGQANTGGGGGGPGYFATTGFNGTGGGSGGFVDALISSPLTSYSYSVGAGGAGGAAGTGTAGAAGGTGVIIIEEYYV